MIVPKGKSKVFLLGACRQSFSRARARVDYISLSRRKSDECFISVAARQVYCGLYPLIVLSEIKHFSAFSHGARQPWLSVNVRELISTLNRGIGYDSTPRGKQTRVNISNKTQTREESFPEESIYNCFVLFGAGHVSGLPSRAAEGGGNGCDY